VIRGTSLLKAHVALTAVCMLTLIFSTPSQACLRQDDELIPIADIVRLGAEKCEAGAPLAKRLLLLIKSDVQREAEFALSSNRYTLQKKAFGGGSAVNLMLRTVATQHARETLPQNWSRQVKIMSL
jgi:hypothetical protein